MDKDVYENPGKTVVGHEGRVKPSTEFGKDGFVSSSQIE